MASTVQFVRTPSSTPAGQATSFPFNIEIENKTSAEDPSAQVDVTAQLFVNGLPVSSASSDAREGDTVEGSLSHTFEENSGSNSYPRTVDNILVKVELNYFVLPTREAYSDVSERNRSKSGDPYNVESTSKTVDVTNPEEEEEEDAVQLGNREDQVTRSSLADTFTRKTPFSIKEISYPDTGSGNSQNNRPSSISFGKYKNPTIAIDTSGRFAKHEIIGGTTVRQKIGEDPITVSINGVCKPQTAQNIDKLRNATSGKIFADRLPGESLAVQFGSTSTEPLDNGGAADIEDGQFLYTFQMNCIEVRR